MKVDNKIKDWITSNCEQSRGFNRDYSSYRIKHIVEFHVKEWVGQQQLERNMHELGYKMKLENDRIYFNIKLPRKFTKARLYK
jgi:hypothetical protein